MKKFIAYYRVSTKRQNLGLDAQRTTVQNYINSVNGKLVNAYEEKESGKDNTRLELHNAIAQCKKDNCTLIIAKLDRLSRNVSFVFALKDAGINFFCCDIPECNTLTLGIFASMAQNERELISQRTKLALQAKKQKGFKLGNPNAVISNEMRIKSAYILSSRANNNSNNKKYSLIIQTLLKENKSLREIADYLNKNDFRTSKDCNFTAIAVSRIINRYNLRNIQQLTNNVT